MDAVYDATGRIVVGVRGKKTLWGHMKILEKFFGMIEKVLPAGLRSDSKAFGVLLEIFCDFLRTSIGSREYLPLQS